MAGDLSEVGRTNQRGRDMLRGGLELTALPGHLPEGE
jgi:hypothetical protein